MNARRFFIGMILILSLFLLSCSTQKPIESVEQSNTGDAAAAAAAALDFRITWKAYSGRGEAIQKIVDSYNEGYRGDFVISMTGGDEDQAAIEQALQSGSDTIYVLPYRLVKYFGSKGYLTDMSADFKEEEKLFYTEIWQLGTVNHASYGIPWLGHSMCLLYNKSLLKKAGVDPVSIKSLDALVEALEKVEQNTGAKGIGLVGADSNDVSWMVNQFVYGFGSDLVDSGGKTVAINNEKAEAALDFYKNVLGKHAQPTWINETGEEVMKCFRNQEVAFEIQGIWGVTDIQKNGSPFDVGVIAMKDIGVCAEVGPMMLAVPAGMSEDKKKEAISFIRYMISKDAQEQILNGEYSPEHDSYYPFRTPIRIDMADSPIVRSNPEYGIFIEGFGNPSIDVPVPAWQEIKDNYIESGLHKVMSGEMTIDAFLDMIETEGNKILNAE